MRLNLPILDHLRVCNNLLIAGMGGGFDVFCGLPIYFELKSRGMNVHLANLTHSSLNRLRGARRLTPTLIGILPTTESYTAYFPELYLAKWLHQHLNEPVPVWCFERSGVRPLIGNYQILVDHLIVDGILLIDGGVDSLMRGDEAEIGSVLEDAASLAAVDELRSVPIRITACLGFGAELEVTYAHILENIAALAQLNAFWGSCSLTQSMDSYQLYEQAILYTQAQARQDASVINSSIVSAVRGHFGDYHLTDKTRDSGRELWISPLMAIYWFFDLAAAARQNLFLAEVKQTETFDEVRAVVSNFLASTRRRAASRIPLN